TYVRSETGPAARSSTTVIDADGTCAPAGSSTTIVSVAGACLACSRQGAVTSRTAEAVASARTSGLPGWIEEVRIDLRIQGKPVEGRLLHERAANRAADPEGPADLAHLAVLLEIEAVLGHPAREDAGVHRGSGSALRRLRQLPQEGCEVDARPRDHPRQRRAGIEEQPRLETVGGVDVDHVGAAIGRFRHPGPRVLHRQQR